MAQDIERRQVYRDEVYCRQCHRQNLCMTSETRSPLHCGGGVAHVHRRANILHFEEKALIDLAETREKEKETSKYSIKEKKERKVNGVAGEEI